MKSIFDICPVCGWEDDRVQDNNPDVEGANPISLNKAKNNWKKYKKICI